MPDMPIDSKQIADSLRVINPIFLHNLITVRRSVAPFFILVIITFFTIFDLGGGEGIVFGDSITLFGTATVTVYKDQDSPKIERIDALTLKSPRRLVIVGLVIALWVLFVRFGFLYYRGIDLTTAIKDVIKEEKHHEAIKTMYFHSIKDAYFTDALLAFFQPDGEDGKEISTENMKRIIAGAVIVGFLVFILLGQYLTMAVISSVKKEIGWLQLIIYFVFYLLFWRKLRSLKRNYCTQDAGQAVYQGKQRAQVVITSIFAFMMITSMLCNVYAIIQYGDTGRHHNPDEIAFTSKIPIKEFYRLNPTQFQIKTNKSKKDFDKEREI